MFATAANGTFARPQTYLQFAKLKSQHSEVSLKYLLSNSKFRG